jgi:chromate transporter
MEAAWRPSLWDLFLGFARIGLCSFGGATAWSRRVVVEERRWLTEREFAEMLGLGQVLPGSNVTNAAVMVGDHFRGVPGATAAVAGLLMPPLAVLVGIALLYTRFGEVAAVRTAVAGMAAAAAGMIIGTALKMAQKLQPTRGALFIGLLAFAAVGIARLPLPLVVLALAPLGVAVAWREEHAR